MLALNLEGSITFWNSSHCMKLVNLGSSKVVSLSNYLLLVPYGNFSQKWIFLPCPCESIMGVPWSTHNPFQLNHLIAFNLCVRFAHIVHYNSLQMGPQDDASGGPVRVKVNSAIWACFSTLGVGWTFRGLPHIEIRTQWGVCRGCGK